MESLPKKIFFCQISLYLNFPSTHLPISIEMKLWKSWTERKCCFWCCCCYSCYFCSCSVVVLLLLIPLSWFCWCYDTALIVLSCYDVLFVTSHVVVMLLCHAPSHGDIHNIQSAQKPWQIYNRSIVLNDSNGTSL